MERRLWCAALLAVLAAGVLVPAESFADNFPGCPAWTHTLTFVNSGTGMNYTITTCPK